VRQQRRSLARRVPWFGLVLGLSLAGALCFLALPVIAIFVHTTPGRLLAALGEEQALQALRLSLETSAIAMLLIVALGTPAAYLLATRRFRGRSAAMTLIELPLVLPPAVAGIGLLVALGPHGILGAALSAAHVQLVLETAGVVVALTFVASPFYLRQAQTAFEGVDRSYLEAALALGARRSRAFLRVAVPLAREGLAAALALAWARALGEFGATLLFAGSYEGVTQTAPLAIYARFATDLPAALALSAVLVAVSGSLLATIKLLGRDRTAAQPPM
jgi:molybdate transport system permease protein